MSNLKDLSIQELLDLAEETTTEETETIKANEYVTKFIKDYGLYPGNTQVPTSTIYHEYLRNWKPQSSKKISKIEFFRNFSKFFEQKRKTNTRYYLLNEGSFDITEENLILTKGLDKRYEKKQKKKQT